MKNLWSWLGVVILVAIVGLGSYYGWQQKDAIEEVRNRLANQNNPTQGQLDNNLNNITNNVDDWYGVPRITRMDRVFKQTDFGFQVNYPDEYQYVISSKAELDADGQEYAVSFFNKEKPEGPYPYLEIIIVLCQDNSYSDNDTSAHIYCSDSLKNKYFFSLAFEKTTTIDGKTADYYDHNKSAATYREYVVKDGNLRFIIRGSGYEEDLERFAQSFKFI